MDSTNIWFYKSKKKQKSCVFSNIASGLHTCLLTLREYSRKWWKWQSYIEAMLLQYLMLYGKLYYRAELLSSFLFIFYDFLTVYKVVLLFLFILISTPPIRKDLFRRNVRKGLFRESVWESLIPKPNFRKSLYYRLFKRTQVFGNLFRNKSLPNAFPK